jgi:glycerophosphoryl diester phosphodiesterase
MAHSHEYFSTRFDSLPPNPHCMVVGNRGCHIGNGNSTASFEAAIACGVDMIKFDVQVCGSGELVVFHESMLDNGMKVSDITFESLQEELPSVVTFEEAMDCLNQRCIAYVDVKGENCLPAFAAGNYQ